ncbi:MAG: XRE family transcriptional regulator [Firmicutes bacterium HGW-Firmicutes-2]|jgi:transcriptional regulator with XRE-family HTH domain|nr:MAG: XRE family transcriptional regulator [Firmicutes bacterium HGW-Firmicutes-2]
MNERLKQLRESLGISQREFSQNIRIGQSTLAMLETGQRIMKDIHISQICSEFGVNEDWLRTGEGEMFKNDDFAYDLGTYAAKATDLDRAVITEWMKLNDDTKKNLYEFMKKVVDASNKE